MFDLPLEIRDRIYSYVLSSPTAYVLPAVHYNATGTMAYELYFVKRNYWPHPSWERVPDSQITLSLLQTCKQISSEAQSHIYLQNTLVLQNFETFEHVHPRLGQWARHIWINSRLFGKHRVNAQGTVYALEVIYGWVVQGGPLRTFTLNVVPNCNRFKYLVMGFYNERLRFEEGIALLRNSRDSQFPEWKTIQRRLDLCVGKWRAPPRWDPYPTLHALHDAFGGELWINGQLCYRNGKEIVRAFERCIVFEHGKSLDQWWQALWY